MGLLVILLGFVLLGACVGLACWADNALFDEDWQVPLVVGLSVFCGLSGIFSSICGIIMMGTG